MIGRMKNGRFLPLIYDAQSATWGPLGRSRDQALAAGRDCLSHFLVDWRALERQARLLRALTEHPEFSFSADGIDAGMVREVAMELSKRIEADSLTIQRLLDEPAPDDNIDVACLPFHPREDTGEFEPDVRSITDPDERILSTLIGSLLASDITTSGLLQAIHIVGDELGQDDPSALLEAIELLARKLDHALRARLAASLTQAAPVNGNQPVAAHPDDHAPGAGSKRSAEEEDRQEGPTARASLQGNDTTGGDDQ